MKKILIILLAVTAITACRKKRSTDDVSKVVTVPEVQIKGDKFITINVGGTLPEDAGASIINDDPLTGPSTFTATESTVDVNTPGLYYMLYSTKTKNGYTVGAARYVAVTDYADDVDLSGTYVRTSNGISVAVTRQSRALYKNADMGGAGLSDALYFAVIDDSTIAASPQYSESIKDIIETKNEALHIEPGNTYFQYALLAPGYGTSTRKFVKQE